VLANSTAARAQRSGHVMAQAVPLLTRATPTAGRVSLTEGYLTQPMLGAEGELLGGRLRGHLMLDFEGLTLRRGELNTGGYGEGYVDRRHPHTYLHEAIVSAMAAPRLAGAPLGLSLSVGRGFAPFGSDDPMVRTFVKYPVNHHLAQVLERVVAIGAARWRGVGVEGAVFNGDEPVGAADRPRWERFGDSWSGRLTIFPVGGVELAGSLARVTSPEEPTGHGLDQRKYALTARYERDGLYALSEWASTEEWSPGGFAYRTGTLLAEAVLKRRPGTLGLRVERTERPEEERAADRFRTVRPHTDFSILGITRWTTVALHAAPAAAAAAIPAIGLRATPFLEIAAVHVANAGAPGVFTPTAFYGSDRLWMLSAGARVTVGGAHRRMGRYGVAERLPAFAAPATGMPHHEHHQH
jgi:hypothetical protein